MSSQSKIGAHVSSSGGYHLALERMRDIGANTGQIFSSSPRDWRNPVLAGEDQMKFLKLKNELNIDPVYFHAFYLINLSNPERVGESSVAALIHELNLASKLQVQGSVVHLGSFVSGDYKTLIQNINRVLEQIPDNVYLIIENAGTRKIGTTIEEIGNIVRDVQDRRVRVALDTAHLHAAGYDLLTDKGFLEFFEKFESLIGLNRLELFHLNDSKDEFGSYRDRHENIGHGAVGSQVFHNLLHSELTKHKPFILEVPGFEGKGPDKKNLDAVKNIAKS